MRQYTEKLAPEFSPEYRLPEGEMSYCVIKMGSWIDSTAAELARFWGWYKVFDNTRSREVLGINYRPT